MTLFQVYLISISLIGQLIKNEFLYSENYEQVFLLTHSLYFFYELTDTNHTRRKENQKLFRLVKNEDGSQLLKMK
ncbi:MAG: AAA family ATPase, partial [Flavobacteriaceae bacterium]|nr:AAA family ATPase [Flavobacteriaceae bacterium]